MEKEKKKVNGLIIDIISIVLSVLSVASLFLLPAARYKYKSKTYSLMGDSLLFGKTIAGGKVTISPSIPLWLVVITAVISVLCLIIIGRKFAKVVAEVQAIAGFVGIIAPLVLSSRIAQTLDGVKSVSAQMGLFLIPILNIAVVALAFMKLYEHKVLVALDFMVLPGMLYFAINNYIPMFGMYIAFKKVDYSKGLWNSPWVGLKNFKSLFTNDSVWIITRNTILYNIAFIVLGIVTGIIVGICLSEVTRKILQRTYQTLILLPQLISFVIVAYIVYAFLAPETGILARAVFGADGAVDFYTQAKYWPPILIFINLWKMLGYNSIVFLSSIVGIDRSLYEAAKVDGATKWKQIWFVTIPQLKPTIITLFLLQCGRIFYSDFGLFYQVTLDQGALYDTTSTIDTFVYHALMVNNNIALASAASTYQAIVGFILVLAVNLIVRKMDKESALF